MNRVLSTMHSRFASCSLDCKKSKLKVEVVFLCQCFVWFSPYPQLSFRCVLQQWFGDMVVESKFKEIIFSKYGTNLKITITHAQGAVHRNLNVKVLPFYAMYFSGRFFGDFPKWIPEISRADIPLKFSWTLPLNERQKCELTYGSYHSYGEE